MHVSQSNNYLVLISRKILCHRKVPMLSPYMDRKLDFSRILFLMGRNHEHEVWNAEKK